MKADGDEAGAPVPAGVVALDEAPAGYETPAATDVAASGVLAAAAGVLEATTSGAVETGATDAGAEAAYVGAVVASASVTGQMVVEIATVMVVTEIEFAGQLVTVGAQLMIVDS